MVVRKRALDAILDRLEDKLDVLREVQANIENSLYSEGTDVDYHTNVRDNGSFRTVVSLNGRLERRIPLLRQTKLALQLTYTGQIDATTYAITGDSVVLAAGEFPYRESVTRVLDKLTKNPANHLQRIGVGRYRQR